MEYIKERGHKMEAAMKEATETLNEMLAQVATRISENPEITETLQAPLFRLVTLYTALEAAQAMMPYASSGKKEMALTQIFTGETLSALSAALPMLARHLGLSTPATQTDKTLQALQTLASDLTHPALIKETWALLSDETAGTPGDLAGEEENLMRASFRAFADKRVAPEAEKFHREDKLIGDDLIQAAAEMGCFGLSIPTKYGGIMERPDHVRMVLVTEELSRGALIFGSLITRPEILARALLKGGTEAQREKFLPLMASGEKMVAVSVTEPDFGSDVAGITTSATPVDGGWHINGTKLFTTFAGRGELIALLARSQPDASLGHKGLSLFVVEKPASYGHQFQHTPLRGGTLTGKAIPTAGYRGMHSFELAFNDYFIPSQNLIGEEAGEGKGFYLQMEAFSVGRLQTAGRAIGVMQAAYEQAFVYAQNRKVFGQPLAKYPLSYEKLVKMAATLAACRQTAYASAKLMDEGEGQMEASMAKFMACRQAEWITREAGQLHGGLGYAEEFPVSRLFIDARVLSIFEGTEEVLGLKVILPALLRKFS